MMNSSGSNLARTCDVFPVFLKLGGKRVVVIGGGYMATEKLPALIESGADIYVIAPEIAPEVRAMPGLHLVERPYQTGDLDGAWYVVSAAPSEVNRAVSEEASQRQIFVNAVDDLRYADVYLGSIIRRGPFTIAISSNGGSPALTALVRRGIEWLLPKDLNSWLSIGKALRSEWKNNNIPFQDRRPLLLKAINAWYQNSEKENSI